MEQRELRGQLERMKERLSQAEAEKHQAAEYGLRLLESHNELQAQLEEEQRVMTSQLEGLEQEKFSLQRDVELKVKLLESLSAEYESCKTSHALQIDALHQQMERIASRDLQEARGKLELLKGEAEEARLAQRQAERKLEQQATLLEARGEEIRAFSQRHHETASSEILVLQVENAELLEHKAALTQEMDDMRYRTEQLELSRTVLHRQVERLQQEKEEDQRVAVSYFNALEKAREANQELQQQLSHALQQAQDPRSKGNSLFGELEDRRVEMERQLISVKVQYKNLQKQHAFTKQQHCRLKLQIGTLLQMKCGQVDLETMQRLQAMLDQRNHEVMELLKKNRELEELNSVNLVGSDMQLGKSNSDLGDGQYYVDLLKLKLYETRQQLTQLKENSSMQRMKHLAESQNVLDLERKLFALEGQLQESQGGTMKLQVKLDELQLKYEPEELNKRRIIVRRREKLPVGDGSTEASPANLPNDAGTNPATAVVAGETSPEDSMAELLRNDPAVTGVRKSLASETRAPSTSKQRAPGAEGSRSASSELQPPPAAARAAGGACEDDSGEVVSAGSFQARPKGDTSSERDLPEPVKKIKLEDKCSPLADRNADVMPGRSSPVRSGFGAVDSSALENCWDIKRKAPGEKKKGAHSVIHISSQPSVENECAQQ
ncbi:protein Spindly [Petromyzon marinus]|uniref:protein Spindly n=1 Tax=Petromyzon marinus TaxID=7757 RepID=UPI003F6FE3B1